ncbi:hypothetical protein [Picosynechococcus sp. PCC 7117]|uniref:hypothetical protein n=1 Tax=Picosynechococcus sp. PCC 7117 TaxID=195498 RepID=UPI000810342C|nr:hypothetical protein [Picosynechococcus sp. PCC 7117]ANV88512.1 hypothetical protein AWQ22_14150 [Picosynechococcus sp. PCC 7117]
MTHETNPPLHHETPEHITTVQGAIDPVLANKIFDQVVLQSSGIALGVLFTLGVLVLAARSMGLNDYLQRLIKKAEKDSEVLENLLETLIESRQNLNEIRLEISKNNLELNVMLLDMEENILRQIQTLNDDQS